MPFSKYVKRFLKAVLFVTIFIVLTLLLDAAFEYDESGTEQMLIDYSTQTDLNTIFVGSSTGMIMDADKYSELTGENAFNMCSSAQSFVVSLKNIKLASSQHKIDKVVLFLAYDTMNDENTEAIEHIYDRVVMSSKKTGEHLSESFKTGLKKTLDNKNVATEESINLWIPWVNETSTDFTIIKGNLKRRLGRVLSNYRLSDRMKHNLGDVIYETKPDIPTEDDVELLVEDVNAADELDIPEGMLNKDKLAYLNQICIYCRNNDIKFMVIATPHRTDYFDRYESFRTYVETLDSYLNEYISKRGFIYYNSEKEEGFRERFPDSKFMDIEHIDFAYTDEATDFMTGIVRKFY